MQKEEHYFDPLTNLHKTSFPAWPKNRYSLLVGKNLKMHLDGKIWGRNFISVITNPSNFVFEVLAIDGVIGVDFKYIISEADSHKK